MEAVARVFPGSQMFRTPCFPCRGPGVDPMGTKMLIASGHDSDYCVWTPLINLSVRVSSVIQSCPTLQLHELQHNRPPCPSPSPGVHSNSCLSKVGDTIKPSHSLQPFSSSPQSLPTSGSFPMSQLFTWAGQSIGVSASASVLPKNTQAWSLSEWTGWISLQSKGLSRVFSNTTVQKHRYFSIQLSSQSNSPIHTWPLENQSLD